MGTIAHAGWLLLATMAGSALAGARDDGPADPEIVVVATPLHDVGEGVLAAPAVGATDEDIAAAHALDATDWLRRRGAGVFLNDVTGNPLQADVNVRGFSASPLLGTPQGLVVWLDGVRLNQPFGDVVSWDLIPRAAIRAMNLVPGSNPLFGRNALGGALTIVSKDGRSDPGLRAEAGIGRFNRRTAELEAGGQTAGGFHWYGAGNHFAEDGWRDFSPSRAWSGFAKAGWRGANGGLALLVDVSPAEEARRDPVSGRWVMARPAQSLPGAVWFPEAGRVPGNEAIIAHFTATVPRLAAGRPVIIFCLADCWMSWNAALRLHRMGLKVAWYGAGRDGWASDQRSLAPVIPFVNKEK